VGGFPIHLTTEAVSSKNITECQDERSPVCTYDTCQNGGTCRLLGADDYQCHCPLGFTGTNCQRRKQTFLFIVIMISVSFKLFQVSPTLSTFKRHLSVLDLSFHS